MCGCLSRALQLGTQPATETCALIGNQTGDPLVCRLALNSLSYTSQGILLNIWGKSLQFGCICWHCLLVVDSKTDKILG